MKRISSRMTRWMSPVALLGVLFAAAPVWGQYMVVLKNGTVMEAKTRPVSMLGEYRFTGVDNKFYTFPAGEVDQEATRSVNATAGPKGKPVVLTNEEVSTGPSTVAALPLDEAATGLAPGGSAGNSAEAYWRGEAGKLRAQMAEVDRQIETVEKLIAEQGSQVRSCPPGDPYCYVSDRSGEMVRLQATRQRLEQEFAALEERGRREGALPGWFRGGAMQAMPSLQAGGAAAAPEAGEAYWRGETRKIQEQMAALDNEIAALRQAMQTEGATSVRCASNAASNCSMTDRAGELAVLEGNRRKLDSDMAELEGRGRRAGAPPGWFR